FDYLRGQNGLGSVPGDVIHILRNGLTSEVELFQTPTASLNGLWTYGAYISDTWRIGSRLTLTPGFRFDRYRSYLPAQSGPPVSAVKAESWRQRQARRSEEHTSELQSPCNIVCR